MEYRILATCDGTMGYRESFLKIDDKIYQATNKGVAEKKAKEMQENVSPYSSAFFSYTVVEA